MKESEIENYFKWAVERAGGKTYKFTSSSHRGVADRIACFPDGATWFVELKTKGGRLSELQKIFAADMIKLNQHYSCLWTKEQVDEWVNEREYAYAG
jgi:hypothetical protein